jgi:hypothetical protein
MFIDTKPQITLGVELPHAAPSLPKRFLRITVGYKHFVPIGTRRRTSPASKRLADKRPAEHLVKKPKSNVETQTLDFGLWTLDYVLRCRST